LEREGIVSFVYHQEDVIIQGKVFSKARIDFPVRIMLRKQLFQTEVYPEVRQMVAKENGDYSSDSQ
ncbi:hypothetical protein ACFL6Q_07145, partial [Candidatus Neomarinimicrobiota bacterium]